MSDISGAVPLTFLQQKIARPIDPEELEMMGKKAAARYRDEGLPLTDAVVDTVKLAMLGPEQVKRVCEFANTTAYLSEFEKGGSVRNITFTGGPADAGKALRDLNDGSNPAINHVGSFDYAPPSGSYKTASAGGMSKLAEAFGVGGEGMEKSAEASRTNHSLHANPVEDLYDLKLALESTRDSTMSKLATSGVLYEDVRSDMCAAVTQEVLGGASIGDVARACASFVGDPSLHKLAMVEIGKHLRDGGYMKPEELGQSLRKVASAGVIPNPQHPVVERFVAFTKVAAGHRTLEITMQVMDEQIKQTAEMMKELL